MPCNMLAVQTAQVQVNEAVLAAIFENDQAHAALAALLKQATGVSMTTYAYTDYSTGRKKVLSLSGGGIDITVRLDGTITVRGVNNALAQQFSEAVQAALAQVAAVIVQNMVKAALGTAGVPVVADEVTAAGGRVMTLRI